jgi:Holliday junction resolvase-like predicted endonuclease
MMVMAFIARIGFAWVRWKSRHGLTERDDSTADAKKDEALQLGVRGERYAYWYLRRLGYVFIARNYMPSRAKGELDLIGYDHETLAIVEVRTRLATPGLPALPEMSIGKEKHEVLVRTAEYFLRERRVRPCPVRFDVIAIDEIPGHPPAVRLHKAALPPVAA